VLPTVRWLVCIGAVPWVIRAAVSGGKGTSGRPEPTVLAAAICRLRRLRQITVHTSDPAPTPA